MQTEPQAAGGRSPAVPGAAGEAHPPWAPQAASLLLAVKFYRNKDTVAEDVRRLARATDDMWGLGWRDVLSYELPLFSVRRPPHLGAVGPRVTRRPQALKFALDLSPAAVQRHARRIRSSLPDPDSD